MATQKEIAALIIKLVAQTGQMQSDLGKAQSNIQSFADKAKKIFAGIGVAAITKKFADLVKETVNMADTMAKTAQRIGVNVETLSELRYAANLSGVSFGELTTGVRIFSGNLWDAYNGMGEAKRAFDALGITTDKLSNPDGTMRSMSDVMGEIADRFSEMEDGAQKTALAQDFFGRSGSALIPLLNDGAAGLKTMADEAQRAGAIFDADFAQAAERVKDNFTRLAAAAEGFRIQLTSDLIPAIEAVTDSLSDLALSGGEAQKIVLGMTIALSGGMGLKSIATLIVFVSEHLRGFIIDLNSAIEATRRFVALDFSGAWKALGEGVEKRAEISAKLAERIKAVWGDIKKATEEATKGPTTGAKLVGGTGAGSAEDAAKKTADAIDKLQQKINELRRQFVALENPQQAAKEALTDFIEATTKGATQSEELKEKIRALWQEYNKYTEAQGKASEAQAQAAENLAEINRQVETSLANVEAQYKAGKISFGKYYEERRGAVDKTINAEITALEALREKTFDAAAQMEIETQIRDKKAQLQQENIALAADEAEETKKLADRIEELLHGTVSTNEERYQDELKKTGEHYDEMLNQLQEYNQEKIQIGEDFLTKEEIITQLYYQKQIELEKITAEQDRQIQMQKLQYRSYIASQIQSLSGQIYSASGEQAEAFFYIQKAAAIANAYLNTAQAVTMAMAHTPGGPAAQSAAASTIWALGMAQIGIILAQAFEGPKKMAAGGLIRGGAGTRDDVPLLGMKDEYMISRRAVRYYGVGFMDAINSMVFPQNYLGAGRLWGDATVNAATNYSINVPVNVENPIMAMRLRDGIEKLVVNVMREYSR